MAAGSDTAEAPPKPRAAIRFERLTIRDFRNLQRVELRPSPRLNVIAGDNGQGKTSLLEALYFVSTSRSFRTEQLRELVRTGAEDTVVQAEVREGRERREQRAVLGAARSFSIDGKRARRLVDYAVRTPVVVFHPGDLLLTNGPAAERRTLLDRIALYLDPVSGDDRARYTRALRGRQHILEERGVHGADLDAFEQVIAEHGARFQRARARAAVELTTALGPVFAGLSPPDLALSAEYRPGGSEHSEEFAAKLAELRRTDLRRGRATFGPQRDELELSIDGRSARQHASQGQQRILTLALKLSELDCIRQARRVEPVLLLDDVSSELDPSRTGAVYETLGQSQNQIFVTTTRPELFSTPSLAPAERADFRMRAGALV